MQKRFLAGLPILAGALIFFGLWIANKLTTPPWKSELNQYIDFKAGPPNSLITLQRTYQASKPWKFTPEMSAGSYSDCFIFPTAFCYESKEFQSITPLPLLSDGLLNSLVKTYARSEETSWNELRSVAPLPFPPEDLWCALVKTTNIGEKTTWVVYIAKHQDLYNADWVVYESSRELADSLLADDLETIGCGRLLEPTP